MKKRHHALSYHRVREVITSNIVRYYHIPGEENPADVLTNVLPHSKWWPLMKPLLHWFEMDDDGKLKELPNCGGCQDKLPKEGQKSPKEGTRQIKQEEQFELLRSMITFGGQIRVWEPQTIERGTQVRIRG